MCFLAVLGSTWANGRWRVFTCSNWRPTFKTKAKQPKSLSLFPSPRTMQATVSLFCQDFFHASSSDCVFVTDSYFFVSDPRRHSWSSTAGKRLCGFLLATSYFLLPKFLANVLHLSIAYRYNFAKSRRNSGTQTRNLTRTRRWRLGCENARERRYNGCRL